jgi:hypothetical protein
MSKKLERILPLLATNFDWLYANNAKQYQNRQRWLQQMRLRDTWRDESSKKDSA